MQQDMDKIIFESRKEIEEIMIALENIPENYKTDTVKRMIDQLKVMHMCW